MSDFAKILPLAITMMAGPQIISAVLLITGKYPVKSSLAYVAAVGTAASIGTLGLMLIFSALGIDKISQKSGSSNLIETALILVLIAMSVKTFRNRANVKPPKWMASLQEIEPRASFKLGMTLILLMPSDLVIMTTVAVHLIAEKAKFVEAVPFLLLTAFIAALPLIFYLLFRKRVVAAMPAIREWMDAKNWIIQIAVYLIFIYLIWQ